MTNIIRYKTGDDSAMQFVDLSTVTLRAIGRKNIHSLITFMLDHPDSEFEFSQFTFDDPEPGKAATVICMRATIRKKSCRIARVDTRNVTKTTEMPPNDAKAVGLGAHLSAVGYRNAVKAGKMLSIIAKPGQKVYLTKGFIELKQKDDTMKKVQEFKFWLEVSE